MSECTKETESNSATSSTINSYSTFKKKLSQWLLYKEQHSMKYLHLKDHLSYVYKQFWKRHTTALFCMAENFVMVGDERLEIIQFHR